MTRPCMHPPPAAAGDAAPAASPGSNGAAQTAHPSPAGGGTDEELRTIIGELYGLEQTVTRSCKRLATLSRTIEHGVLQAQIRGLRAQVRELLHQWERGGGV